ncbi:MAG: TetR/AcrR family transcriptional regulator [Clostridia bacterium]|nr:TetR/AcrR family transcriptional regulator [Clostridia bacterium]
MKFNKKDRRSLLTKKLLKETLLELLKEQPISKITVKELCKRADVNRATFYNHYYDIQNVLEHIEEEYCKFFKDGVIDAIDTNNVSHFMLNALNEMKNDKSLSQILLCKNTKPSFIKKIINMAHDLIISHWSKLFKTEPKNKFEYAYSFMTTGSMGVINAWINNNLKESPQEIADILQRITIGIGQFLRLK